MNTLSPIQHLILLFIPLLFAITVHEVAHGWVALKFGDRTAQMLGRLTLNPIKHIDPIGTIFFPILLFFLGGFIFGWAKPVPVNWQNLKNPKRDMAFVALAGPGANLLMAIAWGLFAKLGFLLQNSSPDMAYLVIYMGEVGVYINLILMVLNLIPIPPLDGSRVVSSLLPRKADYYYSRLEPYGFFILIALLATGALGKFLHPVTMMLQRFINQLFGFG